ncbi:ribokinase [Novilysobacter erysipheiresistens]|uniref:Ribokinase n=1 Tax=Novilysobacter erysipheiresistens TaxID=1749332 RepID=A0ABU7Z1U0_9GAMM
MARAPQVVVVGSFNVDHVWTLPSLPRAGETRVGAYRTGPGGKGFNQATAAARADAATTFICALGDDAGGQLARRLADGDGIDLRAAHGDAPTGTAGIHVDREGRNSIVIGPGANASLAADFVRAQGDALAHATVVLAQLESPVNAVAAAFELAREAGVLTVFNPAPVDAELPASLLALSDVITPNESEFCAQLQRQLGESCDPERLAGLDDGDLHALCRRLLPHGTVIVTLGAQGCFVSHAPGRMRGDERAVYRVAGTPAQVVDTTGAGDAFNGALAASIACEPRQPFAGHVAFANRYAARSTERPGAAAAMPVRADLHSD